MAAVPQRAMTPAEWGLMLLLSLLWGGSFFFIGVAVKELPPLTIVAARVSLAAALLWLTAPLTGLSPGRWRQRPRARSPRPRQQRHSLHADRVGTDASGERARLDPQRDDAGHHRGRRAFLTANEKLEPAPPRRRPVRVRRRGWMIGPDLARGVATDFAAELAVLAAALSYALASIFARRFRGLGLAPIEVAAGQVSASSLMLVPLALARRPPWDLPTPSLAAIAAVIAIASLSTALAYIVYFRILAGAGATNVVLVTLLAPATSILLGAAILGERLAARHFVGLALIAVGLAFIDGRLPRALAARVRR